MKNDRRDLRDPEQLGRAILARGNGPVLPEIRMEPEVKRKPVTPRELLEYQRRIAMERLHK